jgi:diaminopimelate epimerase
MGPPRLLVLLAGGGAAPDALTLQPPLTAVEVAPEYVVEVLGKRYTFSAISMGNPHMVGNVTRYVLLSSPSNYNKFLRAQVVFVDSLANEFSSCPVSSIGPLLSAHHM